MNSGMNPGGGSNAINLTMYSHLGVVIHTGSTLLGASL
jgi:hypothetical protein